MTIAFERTMSVSRFLDPRRDFAPTETPVEIRVHPLTGQATRLAHIGLPTRREYVFPEEVKSAELPIFAPPLVTRITPKFVEAGVEERYERGRCVLFPNLNPYDELSPVAAIGDRSLVEPMDLDSGDVADALALMRGFFGDVEAPRDRGVIGWNFWPASSSSIPHPHLQAASSGRVPDRQKLERDGEERYHTAHGTDFWDDYLAAERDGPRWLGDADGWAAVVDFAPKSLVPETMVVPIAARPADLQDADDGELEAVARWMCRLAAAHASLGVSSFNGLFHPTAADGSQTPTRFRARFIPRLFVIEQLHSSDWTWVQMGTDEGLTTIAPEEWAATIREALARPG